MAQAFREEGLSTTIVYPWSPSGLAWRDLRKTYALRQAPARRLVLGLCRKRRTRFRSANWALLSLPLGLFAIGLGADAVLLGRTPRQVPMATLLWLKANGLLKARLFVELHQVEHYSQRADPYIDGYVVISDAIRSSLMAAGVEADRVLLAPNAVDLTAYEQLSTRDKVTLRAELGLGGQQPLVCYTGQLYRGRNVDMLVEAMGHLETVSAVVVGGNVESDVQRIQTLIDSRGLSPRVRMVGQQPAATAMKFQLAADALVIPYDSRMQTAKGCSPLKIGEYLASGRPIAAFPIPGLREGFEDGEVVWATEETPLALATAIKEALGRPSRSLPEIRARLGKWTWRDRAWRMAEFMGCPHKRNEP